MNAFPAPECRPRALLGWELGGGLGHATRLFGVAERLIDRGFDVLAALPAGSRGEEVFAPLLRDARRCRLIAAPAVRPTVAPPDSGRRSCTLADPLTRFGYGDPERVYPAADRWNAVIARLRPALAVSDASPSLNLVAKGRLPLVCLGSGYLTPPAGRPLPPMRPWETEISRRSARNEAKILEACNLIRRANGLPAFGALTDAFHGDKTFVAADPALDPYAGYPPRDYIEPFNLGWGSGGAVVPADAYVYLPGMPAAATDLGRALAEFGVGAAVHFRRENELPEFLGTAAFIPILGAPPQLAAQLSSARLFVHEGSLGCCLAGLQAGVRQVIQPRDLEKSINAHLAARQSPLVRATTADRLVEDALSAAALARRPEYPAAAAFAASTNRVQTLAAVVEKTIAMGNSATVRPAT